MVIPREFKLFNQTIKVKYSRTLLDKKQAYGLWEFSKNKITLQQSTRKYKLTTEQLDQTFLHEVTHACLDHLGYTELSEDEKFVNSFSNLIHQFITTNE